MATDPEIAIVPLSDDATLLPSDFCGTPNRTEQTQVSGSPSSTANFPRWMLLDMVDMGWPLQLGKGKGKGWFIVD